MLYADRDGLNRRFTLRIPYMHTHSVDGMYMYEYSTFAQSIQEKCTESICHGFPTDELIRPIGGAVAHWIVWQQILMTLRCVVHMYVERGTSSDHSLRIGR